MAQIGLDTAAKLVSAPGISSTPQGIPGFIGNLVQVINAITQLVNSLNKLPMVQQMAQKQGGQGWEPQDQVQRPPPPPGSPPPPAVAGSQKTPPPAKNQQEAMENYFASPQGMNTILGTIDQVMALEGDIKLSVLKTKVTELKGALAGPTAGAPPGGKK